MPAAWLFGLARQGSRPVGLSLMDGEASGEDSHVFGRGCSDKSTRGGRSAAP